MMSALRLDDVDADIEGRCIFILLIIVLTIVVIIANRLASATVKVLQLESDLARERDAQTSLTARREELEMLLAAERDAFSRHLASAPTKESEAGLKAALAEADLRERATANAHNAQVRELMEDMVRRTRDFEAGLKASQMETARVEGLLARTVIDLEAEKQRVQSAVDAETELANARSDSSLQAKALAVCRGELRDAKLRGLVSGNRSRCNGRPCFCLVLMHGMPCGVILIDKYVHSYKQKVGSLHIYIYI